MVQMPISLRHMQKSSELLRNNIILLRKMKGWTITEAASRLGISQNYLSEIEHMKKYPSYDLVDRIAQVYEKEVYELFL